MLHHAASSIHGEGPHVAVLVLVIDTQEGRIHHVAVMSPNPAIHDMRYRYAEVARERSTISFADARERLLDGVRAEVPWVLPYLDEKEPPQPIGRMPA
jgi:hypothetical protein